MNINYKIIIPALLLLGACKGKPQGPPQQVKPYPVIELETRTVIGYSTYPTSIQGVNNNDVRAKIQGYIQEVLIDEGQYVNKGQVLFRLETNTLSQTASAANSGIEASKSTITAAEASVSVAQVEVDKLKPLVDKNIISNVQLETAKANLMRAKSQLDQAKAGYHQAQANYKSAAANVDYAVIRAPISGVVGKINLREGALVGPSDPTPITTISDTRELYAYFSMNEADYLDFLGKVPGSSMSEKLKNIPLVELEMANGVIFEEKGKVSAVTGQVNPKTGTVQFRASFSNASGLLSNGNSGKIRIPKQYNDAIIIPETGTTEQQGIIYAYKVINDSVRSTIIEVEDRVDNLVIVRSGLQKGEIVVAKGVGNLKTNTAITPTLVTTDSILKTIKPIF